MEGETFKSELLIENGQVLINGQAFPLGALLGGGDPEPSDALSTEEMEEMEEALEEVETIEQQLEQQLEQQMQDGDSQ